jgi:pyruvate dehydrogenase E2 component (dihydrolipoamide acetyltransferase)
MPLEFKLPEIGENIDTADIVKVYVKPGDKVKIDQVVIELETDKANVEVPSEDEGTILEVLIEEGSTAKVGQVLFTMDADAKKDTKAPEPETVAKEDKKEEPEKVKEVVEKTKPAEKSTGEIKLPELGENIESAEITKVLVKAGDSIAVDQSIIEIETDKATVEVPSEIEGIVKKVNVKEGDSIKVGDVILQFEGNAVPKQKAVTKKEVPAPAAEEKIEESVQKPAVSERAAHTIVPSVPRRADIQTKIVPAAPSVRKFAREIGVDIHSVKGTGPGGRISQDDVKVYAKSLNEKIATAGVTGMPVGISVKPLPDFSKWGEVKVEAMNNVRKKTAENLSGAWATIPHVTQFDKADITELEKSRKHFGKRAEAGGGKLTVTAILLKVVASALKVFPQFNSSIDMQKKEIIYKQYVNIGVAVDTERGLLVPVIKNADKKNIIELASELTDLSVKARDKKLSIDDMQGGNFSISNLGRIGGTAFAPIVNSPEVAIIGVSRGSFEQVYRDGEFVPRLMLPLSLSYDHRIIDGADAARFVRWVAEALENPLLISLEG